MQMIRAFAASLVLVAACAGGASISETPSNDAGPPSPAPVPDATAPIADAGAQDGADDSGEHSLDAGLDAAPDAADAAPATHDCAVSNNIASWTAGNVRVDYDMSAGTATFYYGGVRKIANFYAGIQLTAYTTSRMYSTRTCVVRGTEAIVTNTGNGLPPLEQSFVLDGGNKFLATMSVTGATGGPLLSTRWISPVVMDTAGGVDVGAYGDVRLLRVPFDNDNWVTYDAMPINNSGVSFEVAAIYDNVTRNGIVVGSITHDTWKSGVYYSGSQNKLNAMNVFGGANDATYTRDVVPHGLVNGGVANKISSPVMFVGYAPDWRDLMEEYANANAARQPRLAWSGGVPFGWNSWGKLQTKISHDNAVAVSDFIHNNLQNSGYSNSGTVYVNLDSYWDNLSDADLADFVAHCHANGQKAGIYWTPFVDWGKSATRVVEGTPSTTYGDVWLKDGGGKPIELDGAYAIDPTHPATQRRIDHFVDKFKAQGFEYVKLDFLTHGALESTVRGDPSVMTGIQAYNVGMKYVLGRIGGSMFVSESIAPLFPYHYAHARRVSCDVYGAAVGLTSSQYELNSMTYGWWMSGHVYTYNDPDSMVFEGFTPNENMVRLLTAVVSGTVFLNGDDLSGATGQALAKAYLTNGRINDIVRLGKTFRLVEGNTGTAPADLFVMHDGSKHYLAVFNFGTSAVTRSIDLQRAGLNASTPYAVTDVWSGAPSSATGTLSVALDAKFAKLIELH
jgi:alpha-galactosidase